MSSSASSNSDALIWRHSAGSVPHAQLYPLPAAFDSAGDFPTYWVMGGPCQGWSGTPYRLNGAAHQTALCGNVSYAASCSTAVTSKRARYAAISNGWASNSLGTPGGRVETRLHSGHEQLNSALDALRDANLPRNLTPVIFSCPLSSGVSAIDFRRTDAGQAVTSVLPW
jgi:hypothetical protein